MIGRRSDLVLFFETEGSGEETSVVGVGLDVGDASGLDKTEERFLNKNRIG